ncbi:hypothetical protein T07_3525 [Trichinella nelsoni]|uniref:Uncharacterized protein n=1 Tax=Trichinella nelsoni TaxID=6336 RepID=A0A0V0RXC3_9BILA|nr:hypothetical protein T07_3525 [Trichinella nelsoni]
MLKGLNRNFQRLPITQLLQEQFSSFQKKVLILRTLLEHVTNRHRVPSTESITLINKRVG